ncbi:MAG: eukaryotic-like serine/threonine-protein kinase [Pseudonocardiales bacterium]|nr:eukaryotic-like serine/threonine-protein kinase [Pseudonocardiales bacterium]
MTVRVPGYQVGELLGYGSYGEVWAATRSGSTQRFALKRIPVTDAATARAVRTEATLLAALDHPSLIRLHEFVVCEDAFVLAMELAEGGSLADLLRRRDRLTPAEVAASLSPIAAALAYTHEEGVLHGDVSAANVLFMADGHPKLADLGVARLIWAGGCGTELDDLAVGTLGTPAYLDPVVAAGGAPGAASDVFSVAAVALHALTGSGPWQSSRDTDVEEVLAAASAGMLGDLTTQLEHCPPAMAAAVIQALDPEPHRRSTAAEFALDLRASVRSAPVVLSAGRLSSRVGRHSVELARAKRAGADQAGPTETSAAGQHGSVTVVSRPAFSRTRFLEQGFLAQGYLEQGTVPSDLTHVARPRVRAEPNRAPSRPRWGRARLARRPAWLILASTAAVATVVLTAAVLVVFKAEAPREAGASSRPPGVNVDAPGVSTVDAAAELSRLDALRELAFATREPALLKSVYADASLLAQDTAQLRSRVPAGCRFTGVSTVFSAITVGTRTATRIELQARATLAGATLACPGRPSVSTAVRGPMAVSLVLTRAAGGAFAIASERLATG